MRTNDEADASQVRNTRVVRSSGRPGFVLIRGFDTGVRQSNCRIQADPICGLGLASISED